MKNQILSKIEKTYHYIDTSFELEEMYENLLSIAEMRDINKETFLMAVGLYKLDAAEIGFILCGAHNGKRFTKREMRKQLDKMLKCKDLSKDEFCKAMYMFNYLKAWDIVELSEEEEMLGDCEMFVCDAYELAENECYLEALSYIEEALAIIEELEF